MHLKSGRYVMHRKMVRGVRECVEFLKAASANETLNFDGELFKVSGYRPSWATQSPPLIYVGATRPQMLRMAARQADGVMFSDLTLGRLDETMQILNDALGQAGRAKASGPTICLPGTSRKPGRSRCRSEAQALVRGVMSRWYIEPSWNTARSTRRAARGRIIHAYVTDTRISTTCRRRFSTSWSTN